MGSKYEEERYRGQVDRILIKELRAVHWTFWPQIPSQHRMSLYHHQPNQRSQHLVFPYRKSILWHILVDIIVRRIRYKVCEECRSKVSWSICPEDPKHAFLSIKNYSGAKESLLAPSTSLVQLLILHLMINIRLHHTIKRNNLVLRDETTRKNRKTLKFSHL